jgi:hypothetical protein
MIHYDAIDWCSYLDYESENGVLRWSISPARAVKVGDIAGRITNEGYRLVRFRGQDYFAHRIIWLISYGKVPDGQIDHKDKNKDNNRISNLRDVSHAFNQQNRNTPQKCSRTGVMGVQRRKNGTYQAKINVSGRRIALGTFRTVEEAGDAYLSAKRAWHPGFIE